MTGWKYVHDAFNLGLLKSHTPAVDRVQLLMCMLLGFVLQEKHLRDENEQLAKNISCLFNTAKAEVARKEKWINRLREELQAAEAKTREQGGSRR